MRNELASIFAELTDNNVRTHRLNQQELRYLIERTSGKQATALMKHQQVNMHVDFGTRRTKPKLDLPNWLRPS